MTELSTVQQLIVAFPPILLAVSFHELAHGWVALRLGDHTAQMLGRLSINPLRHIDPVGTVIVPIVLYLTAGVIFGWAKPVPIDWRNLRRPQRDMALVAAAGPAANLLMAIAWAVLLKLGGWLDGTLPWLSVPLIYMGLTGIIVNLLLAALNLIPLPPLDGSRVASALMPARWARVYNRIEPYGLFVLLLLLLSGGLQSLLMPVLAAINQLAYGILQM